MRSVWDAHFEGRSDPKRESEARAHLPGCAECQRYYQRRLLLSRLDPAALSEEERLSRALGLRPPKSWAKLFLAVPVLAGLLLAVLVLPARDDSGFRARGGPAPESRIQVFNARKERVTASLHASDELAFSYSNVSNKSRLLLFAVDETGQIYWYFPAWTRPEENPTAISVEKGSEWRELPEAISHPIRGKQLTVHAIFTDENVSTREVETRIKAAQQPGSPLSLPNAVEQLVRLSVEP